MVAPFLSSIRARGIAGIAGLLALATTSCRSADNTPPYAADSGHGGGAPTSPDAGASDASAPTPFEPVSPNVYVAKVKNLLVAQPPTDDELQRVQHDPSQLKALIGEWMKDPEYTDKLQRFFQLAFQQTQITAQDFVDQTYPDRLGIHPTTTPLLVQNAQESFARTMVATVAAGEPLTAATTTRKFMLTTALKELYAYLDAHEVDDDGKVTDRFKQANPKLQVTVTAKGAIPIEQTLDPNHANYMHWYDPDLATSNPSVPGCNTDPYVFPANGHLLHYLLYGSLDTHKTTDGMTCQAVRGTAAAPQLQSGDFEDWQMVTIRAPKSGEATSLFYDLPALRSAQELVLSIPRVGFFSTPAFFANWPTNTSNQMRVTLNQALIVGLGHDVDGLDTAQVPDPPPGLDAAHGSSSDCLFCHRYMDPLRSIFSATYSWNYHTQLDKTWTAQKGLFAFQGVVADVSDIGDFAMQLASHPRFAAAWAQKLCYYANSAPCAEDDPEFQRVVSAFSGSSYKLDVLLSELLSSPLVTYASSTATAAVSGEVIAVSRRDHLCTALSVRLGLQDVCGTQGSNVVKAKGVIGQIAPGLPSDGYGRGAIAPVLPNQPTLFYSAGVENICTALAAQVVDVAAGKQVAGARAWSSKSSDAAIADFVSIVMGLPPSDARAAKANDALTRHFQMAKQQGGSATNALRSTFITACMAPSSVSIGL